jgi:hypothetical protein
LRLISALLAGRSFVTCGCNLCKVMFIVPYSPQLWSLPVRPDCPSRASALFFCLSSAPFLCRIGKSLRGVVLRLLPSLHAPAFALAKLAPQRCNIRSLAGLSVTSFCPSSKP